MDSSAPVLPIGNGNDTVPFKAVTKITPFLARHLERCYWARVAGAMAVGW